MNRRRGRPSIGETASLREDYLKLTVHGPWDSTGVAAGHRFKGFFLSRGVPQRP